MRIEAEALARRAHEGQTDKSGRPYIGHPARVAARVHGDELLEAVAWLHDVVEDTDVTLADLEATFPPPVAAAVDAITQRPGESREQYYERVRANPSALRVKLADIDDNTDPGRLSQLDKATQDRLMAKYATARAALARG